MDEKSGELLAVYRKAAGETKKLLERQYQDAKAVEEAGAIAFECGEKAQTLENLEQFRSVLGGKIRFVIPRTADRSEQAGPWHHLYNKMVQGFASAGNVRDEDDAVACAALLFADEGWLAEAEKTLIQAAIKVLRSPSAVVDFVFNLKSERAVQAIGLAMGVPRGNRGITIVDDPQKTEAKNKA